VRRTFFEKYATYGKVGGSGLGTYSARLMARVQQGELSMHTSEMEGTVLELRLPALPEGVAPVLNGKHEAGKPAAAGDDRPLPALSVLLVDDDEFNVAFVRSWLPSPPLDVVTAINGRAAVAAAKASAPDVVFMDLEMPVMNGFEAIGRIRALEAAAGRKPSKVIAFSSYDDDAIRRRCVEAGFDAYLSKPAPRERIHDILRAVAEDRTLPEQALPQRQRVSGPEDPVDVDPDMLVALPRFVETRTALLEELRCALQAGERETARRLAHKLAGSLALYRFDWAADESRAIQRAAADGGDLAALAGRCEALRRHLGTFKLRDRGNDGRAPQAAAGR